MWGLARNGGLMTQSFSAKTLRGETAARTAAEPAPVETRSSAELPRERVSHSSATGAELDSQESAKLRTVRGLNGWTLYCIEDGDADDGVALLERFTEKGPGELLTASWHLHSQEATALTVTLHGGASFSLQFMDDIRVSLALAAPRQLGAWGVDAFELN